jgi:hypothetical protein
VSKVYCKLLLDLFLLKCDVMGIRCRIGSLSSLHANRARNRTAIRTKNRTRVDGFLVLNKTEVDTNRTCEKIIIESRDPWEVYGLYHLEQEESRDPVLSLILVGNFLVSRVDRCHKTVAYIKHLT